MMRGEAVSDTSVDRSYPVGRLISILLAIAPFGVFAVFMILIAQSEGWGGLGYMLLMFMCTPVLLLLSIASVVLAFRKTTKVRMEQTAKSASVTSACIIGAATIYSMVMILPRLVG
jgi:hypothetical protein